MLRPGAILMTAQSQVLLGYPWKSLSPFLWKPKGPAKCSEQGCFALDSMLHHAPPMLHSFVVCLHVLTGSCIQTITSVENNYHFIKGQLACSLWYSSAFSTSMHELNGAGICAAACSLTNLTTQYHSLFLAPIPSSFQVDSIYRCSNWVVSNCSFCHGKYDWGSHQNIPPKNIKEQPNQSDSQPWLDLPRDRPSRLDSKTFSNLC